jgi:hypothetical protein
MPMNKNSRNSGQLPPEKGDRNQKNRFKKGHKKYGGRQKGTRNVTTRIVQDAMLLAAEGLGEDGEGKNGVVGFYTMIGRNYPPVLAQSLAKLLPLQVADRAKQALKEAEEKPYITFEEAVAALVAKGYPENLVRELIESKIRYPTLCGDGWSTPPDERN